MTLSSALFLQDNGVAATGGLLAIGGTLMIACLVIMVVFLIAVWKVFVKAGQPGWAVLIPIYNGYIMLKIAGRPGWWLLLFLVPLVNLVVGILVAMDIAKAFGRSAAFGVILLFLLAGIGYLILGFGKATYHPIGAVATTA
jgi:Family of unknown function (DUF5684)